MSVRSMSRVWDLSGHAGTELLMLLAIADFADDDGRAYPAVGTLAAKTRMSARNVNHILAALKASGELEVAANEGPRGTNRYRIRLGGSEALKRASPLKCTSAPEAGFTPEAPFTLKRASPTPEAGFPKPLKPASDKPSLNRQEPSTRPASQGGRLPACPHDRIRVLYNESLPDEGAQWPPKRAIVATKARKKALASRWAWIFEEPRDDGTPRATTETEALAWFGRFFAKAWEDDHLAGRTPRGTGHEKWRCGIDFLLTDHALSRIVEA